MKIQTGSGSGNGTGSESEEFMPMSEYLCYREDKSPNLAAVYTSFLENPKPGLDWT